MSRNHVRSTKTAEERKPRRKFQNYLFPFQAGNGNADLSCPAQRRGGGAGAEEPGSAGGSGPRGGYFGPPQPRGRGWGRQTHLQPLGLPVVQRRPGVGLARLVQAGVVGVPGEGVDAPRLEDAGGCDLLVRDLVGFHAQRLRATCRVEIHCNTTVYAGGERERVQSTTSIPTAAGRAPQAHPGGTESRAGHGMAPGTRDGTGEVQGLQLAHSPGRSQDGIFGAEPFPASQCLLLQGRVDSPAAQHEEGSALSSQLAPQLGRGRMRPQPQPGTLAPLGAVPGTAEDVQQGRNAGRRRESRGLRLIISHVSHRTLIFRSFSSSPAGKAAGSGIGWGTIKKKNKQP